MVFKDWIASALIALPWLIGASAGPAAQMGAWLVAAGVSVALPCVKYARHWPVSLVWAAGLSLCMALLQFADVASGLAPWVSESVSGEMLANLRQRNQFATLMAIGGLAVWLRHLGPNGGFNGCLAAGRHSLLLK